MQLWDLLKLIENIPSLQFVVQILSNLTTPVFVDPTYDGKHNFIMYADTEWRTKIYAEATENT
jgi:hypothetical protein